MTRTIERLVILGSTITALAIARESQSIGLPCALVATAVGPATSSRIPEVFLLESSSADEVLETVLALAKHIGSALIADSDSWLRWIIQNRDSLQSSFEIVLHSQNQVLEVCLNKTSFIQWCTTVRLPAPRLYEARRSNNYQDITFPVLVRPEITRHGANDNLPKAVELGTSRELSQLLDCYAQQNVIPTICESLIRPNVKQYSIAVARNEIYETRVFVAEKIRPPAEKCAGGTYVVASPNIGVADLAVAATKALGLFGIAEVEIITDVDTGEMFLVEINPRPWVQYALAWQSGFRFLTFLLDRDAYDEQKERKTGRHWLNLGDDLYVVFSRSEGMMIKKEISVTDYIKTVLGANVYPIWYWKDPAPWLSATAKRLFRRRSHGT